MEPIESFNGRVELSRLYFSGLPESGLERSAFPPRSDRDGPDELSTALATYEENTGRHLLSGREKMAFLNRVRDAETEFLSLYAGDRLCGLLLGGSLGVRACILHLWNDEQYPQAPDLMIERALSDFREAGLGRTHVFLGPQQECFRETWTAHGFSECPGEHLFQVERREFLALAMRNHARQSHCTVRNMNLRDLHTLAPSLNGVPELAFQPWEEPLLARSLFAPHSLNLVAEINGEICGVLIGGSCGARGTISHTWVNPAMRGHGIGLSLSEAALGSFYHRGIERVHLMVTAGNDAACGFWTTAGFREIPGEYFLERDL